MHKTTLAFVLILGLGGCAKPVLDIEEPSEWQRTQAQSILNTTRLDSPPAPSGSYAMLERVNSVLSSLRPAIYSVCREMHLEKEKCIETMNAYVAVYDEEKDINAFANQKNEVGIFGGLINAMTDTEIAATLAHEFAHLMFGHPAKKSTNSLIGMTIATGLAIAFSRKTGANVGSYGEEWMEVGAIAGSRAYSPAMEIEADRVAVYILKEAGYSPEAMRDAIVRLHRSVPRSKKISGASTVAWLRTHPSNDRRVAHIMASIRDAEANIPLRVNEEKTPRRIFTKRSKPKQVKELNRQQTQVLKNHGYKNEGGIWVREGPR